MDASFLSAHNTVLDGDWSNVHIHVRGGGSSPVSSLRESLCACVRGCVFGRGVTLIVDDGAALGCLMASTVTSSCVHMSARVQASSLSGCVIAQRCVVTHSWLSARTVASTYALEAASGKTGCGVAAAGAHAAGPVTTAFGCGEIIAVGNSTGGREVALSDCLSLEDYDRATKEPSAKSTQTHAHERVRALIRDNEHVVPFPRCDIGADAILVHCPEIVCIRTRGPVCIIGAASVRDACINATATAGVMVRGGATISSAVVHPGCIVDTAAHVDRSVLLPMSGARLGAIVGESIVASGTVVSEAEVNHSLVGPLVGLHHHALLIAALWPEGKGNIAYGANCGSNHTGKLPDQEILPGEGVFFGLSTSVKYPANFSEAPYTLVASGAITLPQRFALPFSLINQAGANLASVPALSPAINECMPGWMLSDNIYAVYRNEIKFAQRSTAVTKAAASIRKEFAEGAAADVEYARSNAARDAAFPVQILSRMDMLDHMLRGRRALQAAKRPKWSLTGGKLADSAAVPKDAVYPDAEISGLGKNYTTEASRLRGMHAYTRYIRLFAIREIAAAVLNTVAGTDASSAAFPCIGVCDRVWTLALEEGVLSEKDVDVADSVAGARLVVRSAAVKLLESYVKSLQEEADAAATSKRRDTERGRKIIDDYEASHAGADPVVEHLRGRAAGVEAAVSSWKQRATAPAAFSH